MPMRSFARDESQDEMLAALGEDGVIIVKRLIPDAVLDSLMGDVQPDLDRAPVAGGKFFGGAHKRLTGLAAKSPAAGDIIADPLIGALADAVLLDNCKSYRVQVFGIHQVWKGGNLQPLHRDTAAYNSYYPYVPGQKEILLSFITAGSDFTAEGGATRLVPGSHTWPADRVAREDETLPAVMPRGSVVFWLGSVPHGMGINHTDTPRTGIGLGFAVGWLRQEENQYLTCPPEVAATLPPRVQQLLGYRAHSPILGWSEDRDPELPLGPRKVDDEASGYVNEGQERQNV